MAFLSEEEERKFWELSEEEEERKFWELDETPYDRWTANIVRRLEFVDESIKSGKQMSGRDIEYSCFFDESNLFYTPRQTLFSELPVMEFEIKHNKLSSEMKYEIYVFYKMLKKGELDKHLRNDFDKVSKLLSDCFFKVFPDAAAVQAYEAELDDDEIL